MNSHQANIQDHQVTANLARIGAQMCANLFSVYVDGAPAHVVLAYEPYDGSFFCRQLSQRYSDFNQAAAEILRQFFPNLLSPKRQTEMQQRSQETTWTTESILRLIHTDFRAVERGILAIYNLQDDNQRRGFSSGTNKGRGFSRYDRPAGNALAQKILERHPLSETDRDEATRLVVRYRRQLTDLANGKINK